MECGQKYFQEAMICPACETNLTQRDDVVITDLNPTEDYKSVIECNVRACCPDCVQNSLPKFVVGHSAFGSTSKIKLKRTTQEIAYQEIVRKGLNEKCNDVDRKMQQLIREANQELAGLLKEREMERRRHHELTEQYAEKSRQFQKLQAMYDKLKRKIPLGKNDNGANIERDTTSVQNHLDNQFSFAQKKVIAA